MVVDNSMLSLPESGGKLFMTASVDVDSGSVVISVVE